jgi:hypothetical protein
MIYAKVCLKIDFEMTIPMQSATSVDEVNAEIEKDGGKEKFVNAMSAEILKQLQSPFTTGTVHSGTVEIVQI